MKKQKVTIRAKTTAIVILILIITVAICIAYVISAREKVTYASTYNENEKNYKMVNKNGVDLQEIILKNTTNAKKEEIIKKEIDLEYTTKYNNNPNLPTGMIQVIQEGIDGKQEEITKKTYTGEQLIKEEVVGNIVTKSSVNKIVEIGTGGYVKQYNVKVGDELYVTTNFLAVRIEPKDDSEKLITLKKNTKIKVLKIQDEWYQIKYDTYIGWSKGECFTYLNPNEKSEETTAGSKYSKQQLLNTLSFDMKLNKPSGLSLEQFKKIFENEEKDKKNIFKNNAQYFYYAEKQYNVNGVFIAAVAIHESGWGGSSIASNKNNLFGYGAYDRDPYNSAYEFSNYSEGIDLLARVFAKYYLNPKGTKIYDGNLADGSYYNGETLTGVNKKYATDKKWANGVYYWMKYLYNNL
jgi:beta-N-acetylglucosaminidase